MYTRLESDEALISRLMPSTNADRHDRARAWAEWHSIAESFLSTFMRIHNNTDEPDDDLIQDALVTAYLSVERGRYHPRDGVPFYAYVKGIARNKIREARRRSHRLVDLDHISYHHGGELPRQPEECIERREEEDLVRSHLAGLPGMRQQILVHFLNGESTGQIATQLNMSEALVRQHKCRALKAIKEKTGASNLDAHYSIAA